MTESLYEAALGKVAEASGRGICRDGTGDLLTAENMSLRPMRSLLSLCDPNLN
jgi:hypothetical protein